MSKLITFDSYGDNYDTIYGSYNKGQSFQLHAETVVSKVKISLKVGYGSPTGNMYVKLYAHTGTFGSSSKPTGGALATSGAVDASTLTSSYALKEFDFSGEQLVKLDAGYYVLVLDYAGGDGSNYVMMETDSEYPPYHRGNMSSYNGSSWGAVSLRDLKFYLYGDSPNLVDFYSEDYDTEAISLYSGDNVGIGQSFQGIGTKVSSCGFFLKKVGSPTGNAVAKLYAHTGTYGSSGVPTGSALATSGNIDVSTLTTSFALKSFTFSTPYLATSSTNYCVVVEYSGGDSSNYVDVAADGMYGFLAHGGNACILTGTTWTGASIVDTIFYVYGGTVAPTVTTQACSSVTLNTATANGNITETGGAAVTRRGFCYKTGTSGDPTTSDSTTYDDGTFGTGAYTKGLTGLSASTDYRVRAYAVNSVGTSYGTTVQLTTTGADAPVVSTTTTTLLNRTVATVGGNVTDQGSESVTERGIYYGTDEFSQTNKLTSASGAGAYSIFLSGLTPNTKYYYKAFATSSIGTSYGDILNFTTGNSLAVNDKTALPPFNRA